MNKAAAKTYLVDDLNRLMRHLVAIKDSNDVVIDENEYEDIKNRIYYLNYQIRNFHISDADEEKPEVNARDYDLDNLKMKRTNTNRSDDYRYLNNGCGVSSYGCGVSSYRQSSSSCGGSYRSGGC